MVLEKLKAYQVLLASKSPRRRELLTDMGIEYTLYQAEVEENYDTDWSPEEVVQYLSRRKLSTVDFSLYAPRTIFIACDTIVVVDGQIMGKPRNEAEAVQMVRALSGRTHRVLSGLTVATPRQILTDYRSTEVRFSSLTEEEIQYYVQHYHPLDKAGAYGVQEWIGYMGIESIKGSFYNVMGLPTRLLWEMLAQVCESDEAEDGEKGADL